MFNIWLELAPLIAIIVALVGLVFWWRWRSDRKEEHAHAEALTALANTLGGRVAGPAEVQAWSAGLRPPMASDTEGFAGWAGTVRQPRFETALDFRRGDWAVRLGEASMEKANSSSSATKHEHRIEVATALVPPMKIGRRILVDFRGRPLAPDRARSAGPAAEAPVTAVQEQRQWLPVRLPEPLDREFTAFSTDPSAAAGAFNPQVVEWMLGQAGDNPFVSAIPLLLTFEAGLVYTTSPNRIDPNQVLAKVDAIIGLLDRMGIAPAHPPVTH
ncbi:MULTISPECIES: hypothetical protein [Saccharothrix]|uniref:hypothetical protein n=1 Tax=Saccharothrix TaxID=2071 RepID=UPI000940219C|nr:hypothetical protein [Saccharothrix sp. CB00851]OKI39313.1 hypothetical protein A6A25_03960 [Saccharothrix sp. CB00851]